MTRRLHTRFTAAALRGARLDTLWFFAPLSLLAALVLALFTLVPAARAAGDVNQGNCPNEANSGFTPALPDCRAYELVSPAYKDGFSMGYESIFAGGERVFATSFGVFAGGTGELGCPTNKYDLVRTMSGWTTVPFGDITSSLVHAGIACFARVMNAAGETIQDLHPISNSVYENDLYIHKADGSFVEIGPMLPPSAIPSTPTGGGKQGEILNGPSFFTSTPTFSHTLFVLRPTPPDRLPAGIQNELWPEDTTTHDGKNIESESLYEYEGVGNTVPALVGLDNIGHLISDCGTYPGGDSGTGGPGPPGNHHNVMSADGEKVFFTTVGSDTQNCTTSAVRPAVDELFARLHGDRPQSPVDGEGSCTVATDACTVAISEPQALSSVNDADCTGVCAENTSKANEEADWRDANFDGASADGSKVFFTSTQQLLNGATQDPSTEDTAHEQRNETRGCRETSGEHGCNLYEYDFDEPAGHRLKLVSGGDTSGLGPQVQGVAALSEDGSHVYFAARGELTTAPNGYGQKAVAGSENLYVRDTVAETTTFIARLSESDRNQWSGQGGNQSGTEPMDVTNDGRFLVFTSLANLTPGETTSGPQVFRYEVGSGSHPPTLTRISIGDEGFNDNGDGGGETEIRRGGSQLREDNANDLHPAISEDGATVVFTSSAALVPGVANNICEPKEGNPCKTLQGHIYEYRQGHVYLIAPRALTAPIVSPSGRDIFFTTNESLTPQDVDTLEDVYDARIEGGFPPAQTHSCEGEACQGAGASAPAFAPPGGATFSGAGNAPVLAPAPLPVKPKPKALTRAQKLAKALRGCRSKHHNKQKRSTCEKQAHRVYGRSR